MYVYEPQTEYLNLVGKVYQEAVCNPWYKEYMYTPSLLTENVGTWAKWPKRSKQQLPLHLDNRTSNRRYNSVLLIIHAGSG